MLNIKKGIILAGGAGTRMYPSTQLFNKHLQPVYDKPMIYYPLTTLMQVGIRDILLISTTRDLPHFQRLFGNGSQFGIRIQYEIQFEPAGVAQAFLIGEKFIASDKVCLILGDNIFYGKMKLSKIFDNFDTGATIFGYSVQDPSRYGVVEVNSSGKVISIEEKPQQPKSNYVVPGLYLYDENVVTLAKQLIPSERGELEITALNNLYLTADKLNFEKLDRNTAWFDAGTYHSLLNVSSFIAALESRQGLKIACLEEVAFQQGFITLSQLQHLISQMPASSYRDYLHTVMLNYEHVNI